MTIAIDLISTNLGSGTKTYNINLCNEINALTLPSNIKIFICKSYLNQIEKKKNKKIEYIIKSDFLSLSFIRLLWMQLIFPFELKLLGIKKIYSPMNFTPFVSRFFNIKTVLTLHSNLPWVYFGLMPGNFLKKYITKKLMEFSIYTCDVLIVNSIFAKKEIVKSLKIKKNIHVVYLGINKNFFIKKNQKKIKKFNYSQKYILSVISCVKYHNIINLLKAYNLFVKEYDLKLILVLQILDKNYFLDIKKLIKSYSLENKILILSDLNHSQLPLLYKNAKAYVFTSYCEVFGLTSLEAMSQQTPVAVSKNSALPEINKNAAVYFDPDNIDSILNALKKVVFNEKTKKKLIYNSVNLLKRYDVKKNIKKTLNIIYNL
jgi:glycosyltransferase involved in cell wall biosynthesis